MRYAWISKHKDSWPITAMCRVLNVSASGYYHWLNSPSSKQAQRHQKLAGLIQESHEVSMQIYGYRKVQRDIIDSGQERSVEKPYGV